MKYSKKQKTLTSTVYAYDVNYWLQVDLSRNIEPKGTIHFRYMELSYNDSSYYIFNESIPEGDMQYSTVVVTVEMYADLFTTMAEDKPLQSVADKYDLSAFQMTVLRQSLNSTRYKTVSDLVAQGEELFDRRFI